MFKMDFWGTVLEKNEAEKEEKKACREQERRRHWDTVLSKSEAASSSHGVAGAATGMSKGFKCKICSVTLKRRYDLKRHVAAVHLNERPYKCDRCVDSFGHRGTLQKHIRTVHLREKPFICKVDGCGKEFSERGNLNKHVRTHYR